MAELILPIIIGIGVFVGIFLILREFFCWYFKINQLLTIQKIIAETQLKIYEQNGGKVDWENVKHAIHD